MQRKKLARLTVLFHHRWAVPILAELHRSSGAKFVTLVNRLGVSRDTLRKTLDALIEERWVDRNPGYGHPMRPEYVLTLSGSKLGPWCSTLMDVLSSLGLEDVGLRKWSLPVALALETGSRRFSELKAFLPHPTSRALAMTLKNLETSGLIERVVTDDYPPSTSYRLTRMGHRLAAVLQGF